MNKPWLRTIRKKRKYHFPKNISSLDSNFVRGQFLPTYVKTRAGVPSMNDFATCVVKVFHRAICALAVRSLRNERRVPDGESET